MPVVCVLAAVVLLGAGCGGGKRVPAIGPGYEIIVLRPPELVRVADLAVQTLERPIVLVNAEEPSFETEVDDLSEFSFYKTRKLLFALAGPEDPDLERLLSRSTGDRTRTSFPGLWIVTEPFAAGQVLFVLVGPPQAVARSLQQRSDELLAIVEDVAVTLQLTNMFRAGEQEGARRAMRQRWGWGVRLHPQWVVDDEFARENFVRVWRDAPVAQLWVSWEKGSRVRTPDEWLERRNDLVYRFLDYDEVAYDRSSAEPGPTPFGIDGTVLTGVWENEKYTIGGPFRSWAFYCPEDDRTYLVDISAYAPGRSKRPLLRRLEAVVRTFRCGCVPRPKSTAS